MSRFEVTTKRKDIDGIGIIDNTIEDEGEQILTDGFKREVSARVICDKLNELQDLANEKPLNLHKDFEEYRKLIDKMNKNARLLVKSETKYQKESDELLAKARQIKEEIDEDIIKAKYGANNDKVRKQYVEETLKSLADEIQEIKFQKDELAREIGFIKRMIDMKIPLIKYGVGE